MMVALLNKIASLHAKWMIRTSRTSPATAKAQKTTTQTALCAQHEFEGIQQDAFFSPLPPAARMQKPAHPDGSSCGAGCGSSG